MLNLRKRLTARLVTIACAVAPVAPGFALAAVFVASIAAQDASRSAQHTTGVIPAVRARALLPGTLVSLEGTVTVPSGAFKSGTSDEGFALQDGTGGFYVRTASNLGLRVGQRVLVTGQLADSNGQLILVPAEARDVEARGRGTNVRAETYPTGRINEATEGRLVRVEGKVTKPVGNDLPYGYRIFINDGSGEIQAFVYASTGINVRRLQPGQRVAVTGFGGQYDDHYEVIPRFQTDIRRTRQHPDVKKRKL